MKELNQYFPKTEAPFIKESFRLDMESLEQKWLLYMKDIYSRPGGFFFRSLIARQESINRAGDFCRYYATQATKIESIRLPNPKGTPKGKMGSYVCNDDKGEDKSGDFLHSEQLGLFKMRDNQGLETFIRWVKERLKNTVPEEGKPIAQAVLLIYTRSTMCVRCATGTIFDFFVGEEDAGSKRSFKKIIEKGLSEGPVNAGILVVASNYLKSSNILQNDPTDDFERHMRGESLSAQPDMTMKQVNRPTIDSSAQIFHSFLPKDALSGYCQFVLQTQDLENSTESRYFIAEVLKRRDTRPHSLFKVAKDFIIRLHKKKSLQKDISLKAALNQLINDASFLGFHKSQKLKALWNVVSLEAVGAQ